MREDEYDSRLPTADSQQERHDNESAYICSKVNSEKRHDESAYIVVIWAGYVKEEYSVFYQRFRFIAAMQHEALHRIVRRQR